MGEKDVFKCLLLKKFIKTVQNIKQCKSFIMRHQTYHLPMQKK